MTDGDSRSGGERTRDRDRNGPERDRDGSARDRNESSRARAVAALERARTDGRWHALALVVAAALGVAAARVHWTGLVLAGALVGLVSRDLPRAVAGALATGALVLVVFALSLGAAAPAAVAMAPASYVTVASALFLPALGALVRGLV